MILFIVLMAIVTWFFVWYVIRSINMMDDVRFIADIQRIKNPNVPYQKSPTVLIVILLIAIPLVSLLILFASATTLAASVGSLSTTF